MSASSALLPELIEAILCLLPAKSLGRFKSVSKTWNSLISHPHFIKKHLQTTANVILLSNKNSVFSLDTNQLIPYLLNTNSSPNNEDDDDIHATVEEVIFPFREVYGSCNGLFLAEDLNETIFLINPTTHERFEVPLPPLAKLPDGEFYFRYYGFGYDSSTDDYKVVNISVQYHSNILYRPPDFIGTCVSVYSLRNNSWKKLHNSKPYEHRLSATLPVVVNQNIHWSTSCLHNSKPYDIVAFSFTTEEFNVFRLQLFDSFKGKIIGISKLIDIGGKLGLFFLSVGDRFELWVMEDYGLNNSWTKVCCLDFGLLYVKPVCLVEGSNRDIILDDSGDVVVFNIDEERCRKVRIEGAFGGFRVLGTYAESLESPKRILGAP